LLLCSYTDFWQNGAEGQAIILGQFIASIIVCLGIYIAIGVRIKTRKMVGLPQGEEINDDIIRIKD
jgi:hypothetical protein